MKTDDMDKILLVLKELRFITQKMKSDNDVESQINDWKFVAMVIDRACFWIFAVYLIVVTTIIFNSAKN